jgi:hypothetical protein
MKDRFTVCPECNGAGQVPTDTATCISCSGTGQVSPRSRATVPTLTNGLMISLVSVLHKDQRYDTCGDWYYDPTNTHLIVSVSELKDRREMILIAIHELIEAVLCKNEGITQEKVDEFDIAWDKEHDHLDGEPGDHYQAPYYRQHQIATGIERLLAAELGVDWSTYSQHIKDLSR